MKMKMKLLVAAVALAAAGQASAAIVDSVSGNGELFLSVYDSVAQKSYTRDLGIKMDDFLSTGIVAPFSGSIAFNPSATPATGAGNVVSDGYKLTFGVDSLLQNFMGNAGVLNSGITWGIGAMDASGVNRYLSTTNAAASTIATLNNSQVKGFANSDVYLGAVNALTNAADANGSIAATAADGAAFVPVNFGSNWNGNANFDMTALVGQDQNFFMLSTVGTKSTTKIALTAYANSNGNAVWNLASNGTLTYTAATAPSAVPVPAAVWLLGSGLIGMVGVARRRKPA